MVLRGGDQAAGLGTGGWDGQVENGVMWVARVPDGEVSRGLVKCSCDVTAEKHPKGESSMSFLLSLGPEYLHTAEGEERPRPYQSSLARPQSGLWLLGCYAKLRVKHVKPPLTQVTLWRPLLRTAFLHFLPPLPLLPPLSSSVTAFQWLTLTSWASS